MKFKKLLGAAVFLLGMGIFASINGCSKMATGVAKTAIFDMDTIVGIASLHEEITRADVKMVVAVNLNQALAISEKSLQSLEIKIEEKKLNDKNDAAIIKGALGKYKFQIAMAQISPQSCEIWVWAKQGQKREPVYAGLIARTIKDKTGELIEVEKKVEKKPAKKKKSR